MRALSASVNEMPAKVTEQPNGKAHEREQRHNGDGLTFGRVNEIQRVRILAAMAEECAMRGTSNVTVADVVQRAGVSRRTFYELFEDRQDCFLAALDEAIGCVSRHVLSAYRQPRSWRERMRAALEALLAFLEEEPFMGRLAIVETLGAGPEALHRRQHVLAKVVQAIDEGRAEVKRGNNDPPALAAEGALGGVLGVLHSRLTDASKEPLSGLTGELMSMLVLPYLGAAAARRELRQPVRPIGDRRRHGSSNPLHQLEMRLTYRTVRVLLEVAAHPGSSNRELGSAADIHDQGQISKLLARLAKLGLIENGGAGAARGAPNAWTLTERGAEMQRVMAQQAGA